MLLAIYNLLHNVSFIIYIYFEYYKQKQEGNRFTLWQNLGMEQEFVFFCGFLFISGFVSFLLFIFQIYLK